MQYILYITLRLMTKTIFILFSISSGLHIWSVNHTSIYENYESNVFKSLLFSGEIFNNWPNDLLEPNACKTLESSWQSLLTILESTNITSVISIWGAFSPFLSLIIYFYYFQIIVSFQALKFWDKILPLL